MKNLLIVLSIMVGIIGTSCNKTKKYSNRLDGEIWTVTALAIDGKSVEELPTFEFDECDIYEELCKAKWGNEEGGHSHFIWQFREKGKKFEISNQSSLADSHGSHADEEAILQCANFSGVYDVTKHTRKEMELKSTSTIGFKGNEVVLKMKKGGHSH